MVAAVAATDFQLRQASMMNVLRHQITTDPPQDLLLLFLFLFLFLWFISIFIFLLLSSSSSSSPSSSSSFRIQQSAFHSKCEGNGVRCSSSSLSFSHRNLVELDAFFKMSGQFWVVGRRFWSVWVESNSWAAIFGQFLFVEDRFWSVLVSMSGQNGQFRLNSVHWCQFLFKLVNFGVIQD